MLKQHRDILILAGLFLALILFVMFGPRSRPSDYQPNRPTTYSSAIDGAMALYTWTREMGYDARRLEYRAFELTDEDAALVVLNPTQPFNRSEARATLEWVDRGGTLILADSAPIFSSNSRILFDQLHIARQATDSTEFISRTRVAQPAFDQPLVSEISAGTGRVLVPQRDDFVELIGSADQLVIAGIRHGRGYVYVSTTIHPFTNQGLRDQEHAALVLNMLRRVPAGGRIQFDEYHHGFFTPPSTGRVVFDSPWGWAGAYAMTAIALYLVLSGRRFGKPIPLREEITRRSSAEYIESMADLFRRGGKRGYVLGHYHTTFKRRLAQPYGINPQISDDAFVRELAHFRAVDEAALAALLARLRNPRISEAELVRTVSEAEQTLATMRQRA